MVGPVGLPPLLPAVSSTDIPATVHRTSGYRPPGYPGSRPPAVQPLPGTPAQLPSGHMGAQQADHNIYRRSDNGARNAPKARSHLAHTACAVEPAGQHLQRAKRRRVPPQPVGQLGPAGGRHLASEPRCRARSRDAIYATGEALAACRCGGRSDDAAGASGRRAEPRLWGPRARGRAEQRRPSSHAARRRASWLI